MTNGSGRRPAVSRFPLIAGKAANVFGLEPRTRVAASKAASKAASRAVGRGFIWPLRYSYASRD
jgi:hypothetical protein